MNVKILLAYDGTSYLGWQRCPDGPTIEESLAKALEQILQHPITLQAASRTDRGVHAEGQVVNFFTAKPISISKLKGSLNALLPPDIRVQRLEIEQDLFHPTLDAQGKEYHYHISQAPQASPFTRHFSWHLPEPLDIGKMRVAGNDFIGKRDFTAFSNQCDPPSKTYVREIYSLRIDTKGEEGLCIAITGNRFLYKMARNIVGTLVYVGQGKIDSKSIPALLAGKDRTKIGITAPARGLVLKEIFYSLNTSSLPLDTQNQRFDVNQGL